MARGPCAGGAGMLKTRLNPHPNLMPANKKAACVLGWPVEHSRSPLIHGFWITQLGIDAEYRREAVPPEQIDEFIRNLGAHGYVGANVTIPHKEAALRCRGPTSAPRRSAPPIRSGSSAARSIPPTPTSRDSSNNLDAAAPHWDRGLQNAVVLGAGGTARAVVYGLLQRDIARIHVVNRSLDRAVALREQFGERINPLRWDAMNGVLAGAGLVVNTTSLGMTGHAPLIVDLEPPAAERRGGRRGLCAAADAAACRRPRARAAHGGRARDAACTRRCGGSSSGSACVRK